MAIRIDTAAVETTATQVADMNRQISDDFAFVEAAISNLDKNWNGTASVAVLKKFERIRNTYFSNRYEVINDMIKFMRTQVGEEYEQAETSIATAASAFK